MTAFATAQDNLCSRMLKLLNNHPNESLLPTFVLIDHIKKSTAIKLLFW